MAQQIRFEMADGSVMRGLADDGAHPMEYVVIEHVAPDGSKMRERVLRSIAPPPEAMPTPQAPEPEASADEG